MKKYAKDSGKKIKMEEKNTRRMIVLLTRKCQFNCEYCKMRRDKPDITFDKLKESIDFLFTSKEPSLELQFFGGEPLIRFDLIEKGITYSERISREKNKKIEYVITTNGLLMEEKKLKFLSKFNVKIIFSIDGDKKSNEIQRKPSNCDPNYFEKIQENIKKIKEKRIKFFANMTVSPKTVEDMIENFKSLMQNGFSQIQITYTLGEYWNNKKRKKYFFNLKKIKRIVEKKNKKNINEITLFNDGLDEPLLASPIISIDVDGKIYRGCSLVLEKIVPNLQKNFYVGNLNKIKDINYLERTREEQIAYINSIKNITKKENEIIKNNLSFGVFLKKNKNEMIGGGDSTITLKCNNNCIFCPRDLLSSIYYEKDEKNIEKLLENVRKKSNFITLTGGEVTIIPHFMKILDKCKTLNFEKVGIITNGRMFSNEKFAKETLKKGVSNMGISLYSLDEKIHDSITCVEGSLEQTKKGLKNLLKEKVHLWVNITLSKINCENISKTIKKLYEMGIREIVLINVITKEKNLLCEEKILKKEVEILKEMSLLELKLIFRGFGEEFNLYLKSLKKEEKWIIEPQRFDTFVQIKGENREYLEKANFIKNFFQSKKIDSLILMTTYNCQMNCSYCKVVQKPKIISENAYKKAIDVLFSSKNNEFTLSFFGGEPLLYPKTIEKAIDYSEKLKKNNPEKKIKYLITTNGLNIEESFLEKLKPLNVDILISIDGDIECMKEYRKIKIKEKNQNNIFDNLKIIQNKKINYFVNILSNPKNVKNLSKNFEYLVNLGVKRIQVCYESGKFWEKNKRFLLLNEIKKIIKISKERKIFFMNLKNNCEPVIIGGEIIVDVDGRVYYDIAVFHEKVFPEFRKKLFLGEIDGIKDLQDLSKTKKEIFYKFLKSLENNEKKKILINNLELGLLLKELIEDFSKESQEKTENIKMSQFLKGTVSEQVEFKKKNNIKIKSYVLHLGNNCENNCIFCKNKQVHKTSLRYIEYKISSNKKHNLKKICIVGNEPLNHPKILEILDLCKRYNFEEIEIMTSAMFLKDKVFLEKLIEKGVCSFSIPLYSDKPAIHDSIVQRKGDFDEAIYALNLLRKYPFVKIYIHTNLLKQNIDEMESLERYVHKKISPLFCILPIRKKMSNFSYSKLVPSYSEMTSKLKVNSLVGFPICVSKKIQKRKWLNSKNISDSIKIYLLDQNYIKLKICEGCEFSSKCTGTFKDYIKIYGKKEIEKKENELKQR